MAKLTNKAKEVDDESKKQNQNASSDTTRKNPLKKKHPPIKEIKKMLNQTELMEALFPKQVTEMKTKMTNMENENIQLKNENTQLKNEKIQVNEIVKNMKDHGEDLEYISKITNIPIEKIKQI